MRFLNQTRGLSLADHGLACRTFWQRWRGGMGKASLLPGQGWYLSPCRAIHTCGLRFSIDAVYISTQGQVLRIARLAPWRLGPWVGAARGVLELPAGTCTAETCLTGDQLQILPENGW
jgi:uncharacterized protein